MCKRALAHSILQTKRDLSVVRSEKGGCLCRLSKRRACGKCWALSLDVYSSKNVTTSFHAPPGASGGARSTRLRNHQGADARGRRRRQSPLRCRGRTADLFAVGRPSRAAPQNLVPSKEPDCGRLEALFSYTLTCMLLPLVGFGISKVNGWRSPTSIPSLPRSCSLTKYSLAEEQGTLE
jgi:hypothetical protein